jgi:cell division protein FtsB
MIQPRLWFALFSVAVLFLGITYLRYNAMYHSQIQLADSIRLQVNEARVEKARLTSTLAFMRTDKYVEREARRAYGMILPGDIRFEADIPAAASTISGWDGALEIGGGSVGLGE